MAIDKSTREVYIKKLEAELKERKARIDLLRAKADVAGADMRIELQKQLKKLREKSAALRDRLDELRKSGEDAWSGLKDRAEKTRKDLAEAVENAADKYKLKKGG